MIEIWHDLSNILVFLSSIYVFRNIHDQAVLYCVCACMIELTRETGRIDILRAVNSGGTVVGKVVDSYVSFLE